MKMPTPTIALIAVAVLLSSPGVPVPNSGTVSAATPKRESGTASFVEALSPTIGDSFAYQSSKGISVQYALEDGASGEVFNHASGTADAFFQFTPRSGTDGEFQILVYAGSGDVLLTRTYVIPGYAPIITVPPKARVILNDPIDEDSKGISGLVTVG